MNEEIEKKIKELDDQRARLLYDLCEDNKIYHPQIILGLVQEIRSITSVLKILRGAHGNFKSR